MKNEFESIKLFASINLVIIIICLIIVSISNLIYAITHSVIYFRLFFNFFLLYVILDLFCDLNIRNIRIRNYYINSQFKVTKIIRKV